MCGGQGTDTKDAGYTTLDEKEEAGGPSALYTSAYKPAQSDNQSWSSHKVSTGKTAPGEAAPASANANRTDTHGADAEGSEGMSNETCCVPVFCTHRKRCLSLRRTDLSHRH